MCSSFNTSLSYLSIWPRQVLRHTTLPSKRAPLSYTGGGPMSGRRYCTNGCVLHPLAPYLHLSPSDLLSIYLLDILARSYDHHRLRTLASSPLSLPSTRLRNPRFHPSSLASRCPSSAQLSRYFPRRPAHRSSPSPMAKVCASSKAGLPRLLTSLHAMRLGIGRSRVREDCIVYSV